MIGSLWREERLAYRKKRSGPVLETIMGAM